MPATQNGGGSADGFLSLSSKDAKLINFPGYMLGTWSVKRACVGRWCLQGACPPALEGSIIGGPAETTFAQRFNASTSRRLGDKTAQQMVLEDKGYNLQELWQAQPGRAPRHTASSPTNTVASSTRRRAAWSWTTVSERPSPRLPTSSRPPANQKQARRTLS